MEDVRLQVLGLLIGILLSGGLNWENDGLWFQGDAPRQAVNGLFTWDLLTTLPRDPLAYSLSYYARYPVVAPVAYPPLFHLLEGVAFWAVGPSPLVAKLLVLAFGALAGAYVLLWGRRRIAPLAGWAGMCTVLLPGFVLFSNAVVLNIPGVALGLGALHHLQNWLDTSNRGQLRAFGFLLSAAVLTYYPAGIVVPAAVTWIVLGGRHQLRQRALWALFASVAGLLVLAAVLLPVYFARHAPTVGQLMEVLQWTRFMRRLSWTTGAEWLAFGLCGVLAGVLVKRLLQQAVRLASAFGAIAFVLVAIPWLDSRYGLVLGPISVLATFLAVEAVAAMAGRRRTIVSSALVMAVIALAVSSGVRTNVPVTSGFDQVADFLRVQGPTDSVIYRGRYDGIFGFYARAGDPRFERRLVLWRKLNNFIDDPTATPADVVHLIRTRTGSRWIVNEIRPPESSVNPVEKLLNDALSGPEFRFVRSFAVEAAGVARIDVFEFLLPLQPAPPLDLSFGRFTQQVFRTVHPIPTRN